MLRVPDWVRTSDPQLRRLMLYPTELRALYSRHCEWLAFSLGIAIAAVLALSGRRDSNSGPPAPKTGALPAALHPVFQNKAANIILFRREANSYFKKMVTQSVLLPTSAPSFAACQKRLVDAAAQSLQSTHWLFDAAR